jgi:hypothetical protein
MTARALRSLWPIISGFGGFYLKMLLAVWAAIAIIVGLVIAGFAIYDTEPISTFDNAATAPRYWMMVSGFMLVAVTRKYVAHGVARHRVIAAGTVIGLAATITAAALTAVTYLTEYLVYQGLGWREDLQGPHLFTSGDQAFLVFVEFLLVFGSHFFAGWLIGSLFYRFRLWATPLAVLVYTGAIAIEGLLGTGWLGTILVDNVAGYSGSWQLAAPTGLLVIAIMAVANWAVLRDIPIGAGKI